MTRIVPLILAGGQGTRLWPMSRSARPKQFLPLVGALSLYQETIKRTVQPYFVLDGNICALLAAKDDEAPRPQALLLGFRDGARRQAREPTASAAARADAGAYRRGTLPDRP